MTGANTLRKQRMVIMADQDLTPEAVERLATDLLRLDVAYKMPTCTTAAHTLAALSAALEAEKARAENYGTLANVNQHGWDLEKARAEKAEAERDALKAVLEQAANRLEWCAGILPSHSAREKAGIWVAEIRAFLASLEGDKP